MSIKKNKEICNVGFVHQECAEARLAEYQQTVEHNYKKGDFVKCSLKTGAENIEHMWVLVTESDEKNKYITGTLNNEPVHASESLKFGDVVRVQFSEIADCLTNYSI